MYPDLLFSETLDPIEELRFLKALVVYLENKPPLFTEIDKFWDYIFLIGRSRRERLILSSLYLITLQSDLGKCDDFLKSGITNKLQIRREDMLRFIKEKGWDQFVDFITSIILTDEYPSQINYDKIWSPLGDEFCTLMTIVHKFGIKQIGYPPIRDDSPPKGLVEEFFERYETYAERQARHVPAVGYKPTKLPYKIKECVFLWRRWLLREYGFVWDGRYLINPKQASSVVLKRGNLDLGPVRRIDGAVNFRPKDILIKFTEEMLRR